MEFMSSRDVAVSQKAFTLTIGGYTAYLIERLADEQGTSAEELIMGVIYELIPASKPEPLPIFDGTPKKGGW